MATTLVLLTLAVTSSSSGVEAFIAPFVRPNHHATNINTAISESSSSWYSSTSQDQQLWSDPSSEGKSAFMKDLKVIGDDDQVMNQVQIPGMDDTIENAILNKEQKLQDRMEALEETNAPKRKVRASVKETGYDSMRNYIKTMCNHELLNKNEEVVLAREIQTLIKWEEERENLEKALLRYVLSL